MQEQTSAPSKSVAFVVFVKTPGLSPVKTRLAKGIGKESAEEFYKLSVCCVEEIGEQLTNKIDDVKLDVLWAVAEANGLASAPGPKQNCLFQGHGSLGERLANIYEQLKPKYDLILFVGGDCPQMQVEDIMTGISYLRKQDCFVLGPAEDGGFWLWGGSYQVPKEVWTQVSYSQESTYRQMWEQLSHLAHCFDLASYSDVDHAEDLGKLCDFFKQQKTLLPSQQKLMEWLSQNV